MQRKTTSKQQGTSTNGLKDQWAKKAREKKCVLNLDLKAEMEGALLMSSGSLFRRHQAMTANALSLSRGGFYITL